MQEIINKKKEPLKDIEKILKGYLYEIELFSRARRVLKLLDATSSDTILEVGCGSGLYTNIISKVFKPKFFVAIDKTENYAGEDSFKKAKELNKDEKVFFKIADVKYLPFKDKTFDKSVMIEVIEHIDDDVKALKELGRVTKDCIILTTPNIDIHRPSFPSNILIWVLRKMPENIFKEYSHQSIHNHDHRAYTVSGHIRDGYTIEGLKNVANQAGLEVVEYSYAYKFFTKRVIDLFYTLSTGQVRKKKLQKIYFVLEKIDDFFNSKGLCIVAKLKSRHKAGDIKCEIS